MAITASNELASVSKSKTLPRKYSEWTPLLSHSFIDSSCVSTPTECLTHEASSTTELVPHPRSSTVSQSFNSRRTLMRKLVHGNTLFQMLKPRSRIDAITFSVMTECDLW